MAIANDIGYEVTSRLDPATDTESDMLVPGSPERLGAMIESDLYGWKKLIADFGLRFE